MAIVSAVLSFIGIALLVLVGVIFVWCLIAGIPYVAKIVSGYLWWVGSALFWIAVAAVAIGAYLMFFAKA